MASIIERISQTRRIGMIPKMRNFFWLTGLPRWRGNRQFRDRLNPKENIPIDGESHEHGIRPNCVNPRPRGANS